MSTATLLLPETPAPHVRVAPVPPPSWAHDDPPPYEVVDGLRVEMPPMSVNSSMVGTRITVELTLAARAGSLGQVASDTLFRLPLEEDGGRNRRPDVAFVSFGRWAAGLALPLKDNAWDVVPDLAIEVVSPTDRFEDVIAKVDEYFRADVRLVWVVLPVLRQAYLYDGPRSVLIIDEAGSLDGGAVLPGFALPLGSVLDAPPAKA